MTRIALDFETYSPVNLKKHGLRNYLDDPDFCPLIAVIWDEGGPRVFDFVTNSNAWIQFRNSLNLTDIIIAHNAEFEYQVLRKMGINATPSQFLDTATLVRCHGGSSSLDAASRQFLWTHKKVDEGSRLIKKFCMPGPYQVGNMAFAPEIVRDNPLDWDDFIEYCIIDTEVAWLLEDLLPQLYGEAMLNHPTFEMNRVGWPVDLKLVKEMQLRYLANLQRIEQQFRWMVDDDPAKPLNLNSHAQLKKWCLDRGVKATSFDKEAVAALIPRMVKKINNLALDDPNLSPYSEVLRLLHTKQELGGSSLKKLQTILDTVSADGRLHNQYIHVGAVQSWRTTGVGVQMQNLKRIGEFVDDVEELEFADTEWSNDKLSKSLRQCFTSSHPEGQLIVGDFSSVESRALAWLAHEQWKLDAYVTGRDLYKVQASQIYGIDYLNVSKEQRQTGKLGELSCGYGAGRKAVTKFAKNMGIDMSEDEAGDLVSKWRDANPRIVELWQRLEDAVRIAYRELFSAVDLAYGELRLKVTHVETPRWIVEKNDKAHSIGLQIHDENMQMQRIFHGVHMRGNDICYFKPSSAKSGDPWVNYYRDPKTHQVVFYTIYGGKIAGILTQSLCREIFMQSLKQLASVINDHDNVDIIGQFHDEIVVDWIPNSTSSFDLGLDETKHHMEVAMTSTQLPRFPLAAEIKSDYRYTK